MLLLLFIFVSAILCKDQYSVVIDAGSTGSRIHLFRWFYNRTACGQKGAVNLYLPEKTVKLRPGLITYISNEAMSLNLDPISKRNETAVEILLNNYVNTLRANIDLIAGPDLEHSQIPIFYLATAGFRQLPEIEQALIIKVLRKLMVSWDYMVKKSWIQVLDGRKEGLFSWVFLNHLFKRHVGNTSASFENLLILPENNQLAVKSDMGNTKLIEFGGASTQVVFKISNEGNIPYNNGLPEFDKNPDMNPILLKENIIQLHFCNEIGVSYGRQLALQIFIQNYMSQTNSSQIPCLPPDVLIPLKDIQDLAFETIGRPLTDAEKELIDEGVKLNGITGLSNSTYQLCKIAVKKYLLSSLSAIPNVDEPFIDVVGNENIDYFHQLVAIPRRPYSTETNLDWFRRRAEILCRANSYVGIQDLLHPDAEFEKVVTGCFGLTFILNFLRKIVHVPKDKPINALSKISGVEVTWPAGFILTEMFYLLTEDNQSEVNYIYDEL